MNPKPKPDPQTETESDRDTDPGADSHPDIGEQRVLLPASLLVRCSALAVDLCVAVTVSTLGFALVSSVTPADAPGAKMPIGVILLLACGYIAWGRNRYASVGRSLFRLQVAHAVGPGAKPTRPVLVHVDAQPLDGTRAIIVAVGVTASCALLSTLALTQVLGSTTVYRAVSAHTSATQPFAAQYGDAPVLAGLPTALLIGERRAWAQVGARWGERDGLLDYFLQRHEGRWQVQAVREAAQRSLPKYALAARDADIPEPPP